MRRATVAMATNPEGRSVRLDQATWNHVLEEHLEMTSHLNAVMATISRPEYREPDPRPGRERYFRRGGPGMWLRVVTAFDGEQDRVVTAFPRINDPTQIGGAP